MAKEKSLGTNGAPHPSGKGEVRVRYGRVESVDLFEIKDSELDLFEKGSPADLQLNFSIFLLSTAFAAICSIASADFKSSKVEIAFYVVAFCGTVIGIFLFISWWRSHTSLKQVCERIRARIRPDSSDDSSAGEESAPAIAFEPVDPPAPKG